jgi:GNAT superfamily N-acetyltransferase
VDLHASPSASALDLQLQQYVRAIAPFGRETAQIGPFLATFHPTDPLTYVNYAIPDDGARPTAEDVAALVAAYEHRGRVPRLEYLPSAAPHVEAALLAGGFVAEARLPAMTCVPEQLVPVSAPDGIEIAVPRDDVESYALLAAQHDAFGDSEPDEGSVARIRAMLDAGALAVLARDRSNGEVVGGGLAAIPSGGVTEIAGIGVRAGHRRQGIAAAMTARVTADAFAAGLTTAFLTPGNDGAHRVYARAGFVDSTVMLHISRTVAAGDGGAARASEGEAAA